jgi:hypothetical protein
MEEQKSISIDEQIHSLEESVAKAKESLRISEVAFASIRESLSGAQPKEKLERPNIILDASRDQSGQVIKNPLNRVANG